MKYFHPELKAICTPATDDKSLIPNLLNLGWKPFNEIFEDYLFVDYTPLFDWIKETLELPKDTVIEVDFSGKRLQFVDVNIPVNGAFAAAFKDCSFNFFSFTKGDTGFWATLNLNYSSYTGGSNGVQFAEIAWDNVAGWKVCETRIGRWHCL